MFFLLDQDACLIAFVLNSLNVAVSYHNVAILLILIMYINIINPWGQNGTLVFKVNDQFHTAISI